MDNLCFLGDSAFVVLKNTSGTINSVPPNKSVYLSAKRRLLKVAPSHISCPFLQTAESFWKLVSKDRFPKLQDFALKMHSIFGSTHVRENTFSILSSK